MSPELKVTKAVYQRDKTLELSIATIQYVSNGLENTLILPMPEHPTAEKPWNALIAKLLRDLADAVE